MFAGSNFEFPHNLAPWWLGKNMKSCWPWVPQNLKYSGLPALPPPPRMQNLDFGWKVDLQANPNGKYYVIMLSSNIRRSCWYPNGQSSCVRKHASIWPKYSFQMVEKCYIDATHVLCSNRHIFSRGGGGGNLSLSSVGPLTQSTATPFPSQPEYAPKRQRTLGQE